MAVNTYSVTWDMVASRLPLDTRDLSADGNGLTTSKIEDFIKSGAAAVTPFLTNTDRATTITDDDMLRQVQDAVIAYAKWQSLKLMPQVAPVTVADAEREWLEILGRYGARSQYLKTQDPDRTNTNIDTTSDKAAAEFAGLNYEF